MTDLSIAETRTLAKHERTIEAGQKHFVAVGNALAAIRDAKLYRGEFATFPDYCRDKWGFNKSRAYQFIEAASVVAELPQFVDAVVNEGQARAIADVPREQRAEVLQAAIEDASPKPPTARKIAETAARLAPEPEQEYAEPGEVVDEPPPARPEPLPWDLFACIHDFRVPLYKWLDSDGVDLKSLLEVIEDLHAAVEARLTP